MLKQLLCYCQYILPQHLLSKMVGLLANSTSKRVKNNLIDWFCKAYAIDLHEAVIEAPHRYPTFNAFFTRALKPGIRPVDPAANSIVSPADGTIAEIGNIHGQRLIQAKDMYFDLNTLFGGQQDSAVFFENGNFATIYLAPHNYHRVHMPYTGTLRRSIYIPGKLFSVNKMTSQLIPNLYARNERLILLFDTDAGPMAVILVGAMIVGSIQTVWMEKPIRSSIVEVAHPNREIRLEKGQELGHFQMGSTVILLFPQNKLDWATQATANGSILTGQSIASLKHS